MLAVLSNRCLGSVLSAASCSASGMGVGVGSGNGGASSGQREPRLRLKSATADGSRISLAAGGGGGGHVSSLVRLALSSSNFPEVLADLLGSMPLVNEVSSNNFNCFIIYPTNPRL